MRRRDKRCRRTPLLVSDASRAMRPCVSIARRNATWNAHRELTIESDAGRIAFAHAASTEIFLTLSKPRSSDPQEQASWSTAMPREQANSLSREHRAFLAKRSWSRGPAPWPVVSNSQSPEFFWRAQGEDDRHHQFERSARPKLFRMVTTFRPGSNGRTQGRP